MSRTYAIRAMLEADIPAILRIQAEFYEPAMVEDEAAIRRRYRAAPDTAWVAADRQGVCAYLVAYRSLLGKVTALGGDFSLPAAADSLYFHDLAVSGRVRGLGVGPALAHFAWNEAGRAGLRFSSLVSVQDSRAYWQQLGYVVSDCEDVASTTGLHSYPAPAWYMVKRLA